MNRSIVFVIPMAGLGTRFKKAGYSKPKYLVTINKKTIFDYSLKSLPLWLAKKVVFIGLEEHDQNFKILDFIEKKINLFSLEFETSIDHEVILLRKTTRGQAESVLKAKEFINTTDELLIYNVDTYFISSNLSKLLSSEDKKHDGVIGAFHIKNFDNKWSFADISDDGFVKRTTEKIKISDYALTGLYHFTKANDFFKVAEDWVTREKMIKGEFYIAPMYNDLINKGKHFVIDIAEELIPLGTPDDVERFRTNESK